MTHDTEQHVLLIMHELEIMKFQGEIKISGNNYFSLMTHTVKYSNSYFINVHYLKYFLKNKLKDAAFLSHAYHLLHTKK